MVAAYAAIWLLAVGAVSHPGSYRDYFDRRTVAGKNKMDTLVAIGRKLMRVELNA